MKRFGLGKYQKIRSEADFRMIIKEGRSYADRYLVMYVFKGNVERNLAGSGIKKTASLRKLHLSRLGISVDRKVGKAVVRNRIKRWIRETFRLHQSRLKEGIDILLIARPATRELEDYMEMEKRVLAIWARGSVIRS